MRRDEKEEQEKEEGLDFAPPPAKIPAGAYVHSTE